MNINSQNISCDNDKPIVVISEPLQQQAIDFIAPHANTIHATAETAIDYIENADALVVRTYTQVNQKLIDRAKKLKVVGRAGVALENIDVPACRSAGIEVVHTPAANTLAVVDYTIRMIVELNRRFWAFDQYITHEEFHSLRKNLFGRFLSDCTLGIIGAGRIGSRVGRAAAGLGMRVIYNDIKDIDLEYQAEAVTKEELYKQADIITIHTPINESTSQLICTDTISQTKPGVQFINAARGPCVNYNDLAEAIKSGHVSGAAIDCHDPEPIPADYPMLGLDNVILTPHVAACVPHAKVNMSMVVKDILAVLNGKTPLYPALEGSY